MQMAIRMGATPVTDPRRRLEKFILSGDRSRAACEALLALGLASAAETVAGWALKGDASYGDRHAAVEALEGLTKPVARATLVDVFRRHDVNGERALAERALVALEDNLDAKATEEIEAFVADHRTDVSCRVILGAARRALGRPTRDVDDEEERLIQRWRDALAPERDAERAALEAQLCARWDDAAAVVTRAPAFCDAYEPRDGAGVVSSQAPQFVHRLSGVVFVRVPALAFDMGSPSEEEGHYDDERLHRVLLRPFLLARTPLTWGELSRLGVEASVPEGETDEHPASHLSWEDAMRICAGRWTLPTEAQWEGACRAGTSGPYGGTGELDSMGWYAGNCKGPQPVAGKEPNAFGLYDMHGNVREWCADVADWSSFYESARASDADPICLRGSTIRVLRGGSYWDDARYCRSACRLRNHPLFRSRIFGFRPARPLR